MTLEELRERLSEVALLDVRTQPEFSGLHGAACDPRQGHLPGARNVPLDRLLACRTVEDVREVVALPAGTEVVAYCHTGNRSAYAVQILAAAGYEARNYVGSWHEWSRDPTLPSEGAV